MPARRASKVSSSAKVATNTAVVPTPAGADGGIISTTREEPPRKRSKVYDDDRIEADIRAVYPNWVPVDPFLLMEHGFAGSPSSSTPTPPSSSGQGHGNNTQGNINNSNPLNDISRLRLDSLSGGGGSSAQTASLTAPSQSQPQTQKSGKGRGKGRGRNKTNKNDSLNIMRAGVIPLRNAEHDIPELVEGPYAVFLDRHGQRAEYFPAAMLKRLEKERQKRGVPAALPATPESLPPPSSPSSSEGPGPSGNNSRNAVTTTATTTHTHSHGNDKDYVWIVTHTQQGGYDRFRPVQRGIPDSSGAGSGVRFHGVFSTLEDANVKAMEVFQKLHRDFMLCPRGAGGLGSTLGFGLLGGSDNSLGFREMPGDGHYNNNNNNNSNTAVDGSNSSSSPFFESHPALQEDAEGASWWVDDWGCLSLRAMNWGTGDSRIFVARQEFNH